MDSATIGCKKNFRNGIWHEYEGKGHISDSGWRFVKLARYYFISTINQSKYNFRIKDRLYLGSIARKKQGVLHRFKKGDKPFLVSKKNIVK